MRIENQQTTKEEITLCPSLIGNKSALKSLIEEYYIGKNRDYSLLVPSDLIPMVEVVFDELIRRHGVTGVNFEYKII